jgi:hypothetical protein
MKERSLRAVAREVIERMTEQFELVSVDSRDKLGDEQVAALVRGDWSGFDGLLEEWESDQLYAGAKFYVDELTSQVFREWETEDGITYDSLRADFPSSEQFEEARLEAEQRDSGAHVQQLANQTPAVLLRVRCIDEDHGFSFEPVSPQQVLERCGLEASEHNVAEVQLTLDECSPEFSSLMGFWVMAVDPGELYRMGFEVERVRITNPFLYLGNPLAGSGFISPHALHGSVVLAREDLRTDADAFGYSLEKVYGGLRSSDFEAKIEAMTEEAS